MSKNTKQLKSLQAKWYKTLARDGFNDIEQDENNLKDWTSTLKRQWRRPVNNTARMEYYRVAGHFLYDYEFETKFDRRVWELHADGVTIESIIEKMKAEGFTAYRDNVHAVIKKLSKIMVKYVREKSASSD